MNSYIVSFVSIALFVLGSWALTMYYNDEEASQNSVYLIGGVIAICVGLIGLVYTVYKVYTAYARQRNIVNRIMKPMKPLNVLLACSSFLEDDGVFTNRLFSIIKRLQDLARTHHLRISIVADYVQTRQDRKQEVINFVFAKNQVVKHLQLIGEVDFPDEHIYLGQTVQDVLKQHPHYYDVIMMLGCDPDTIDFDNSLLKPTTQIFEYNK